MPLDIEPLHPLFAAEVSGVDFSTSVGPETMHEILATLDRYAVCVYRGTGLDDERRRLYNRGSSATGCAGTGPVTS